MPPQETLTYSKSGLAQSGSVGSLGPGVHKVLFEPSEYLWGVWGLILNVFHPSYNLAGASHLPLDLEYLFWWDPVFC